MLVNVIDLFRQGLEGTFLTNLSGARGTFRQSEITESFPAEGLRCVAKEVLISEPNDFRSVSKH